MLRAPNTGQLYFLTLLHWGARRQPQPGQNRSSGRRTVPVLLVDGAIIWDGRTVSSPTCPRRPPAHPSIEFTLRLHLGMKNPSDVSVMRCYGLRKLPTFPPVQLRSRLTPRRPAHEVL